MTPGTEHPRAPRAQRGGGAQPRIPQCLLIAAASFGPRLPAAGVAAAIARGLRAGGRTELDLCPFDPCAPAAGGVAAQLQAPDFDARMRRARALIVAAEHLEHQTLARSVTFELASRARQGGVPAYAVSAANALDLFDARILDLQLILEASSAQALALAGRRLAGLV